jgi:hypothetical protein
VRPTFFQSHSSSRLLSAPFWWASDAGQGARYRPRRPPRFFGSRPRCSALRLAQPSRGTGIALFSPHRPFSALSGLYFVLGIDPAAPALFRLPPPLLGPAPGATLARHGGRSPPHAPPAFRALSAVFSSRHRPCRPRPFFGSRPRHSALRPAPPSRGTSIALLPLRRQLPALPAPYLAPGIEPAAPHTFSAPAAAARPCARPHLHGVRGRHSSPRLTSFPCSQR